MAKSMLGWCEHCWFSAYECESNLGQVAKVKKPKSLPK